MEKFAIDLRPFEEGYFDFETTNRCICPQKLLGMFNLDLGGPLIARLEGIQIETSLLVYNFHTEDNYNVYVPKHVLEKFQDEICIFLQPSEPPTIEYMKVKCLDYDEASKELIENTIVRNYQVISMHDILKIGGWSFEVIELEPAKTVQTYNSDPEIAFEIKPPVPEYDKFRTWLECANKDKSMWKYPRFYFGVNLAK